MKVNFEMHRIKSYLIELVVVTVGVLIALVISNIKEAKQARDYQTASRLTIQNEVRFNQTELKRVIGSQSALLDTLEKYSGSHTSLNDLLYKAHGIQSANLSNTGLEFYKRNQINAIDFEMMSMLIRMNTLSDLIYTKLEKMLDYLYPNIFSDSEESKRLAVIYLRNIIESETQLLRVYDLFLQGNRSEADTTG